LDGGIFNPTRKRWKGLKVYRTKKVYSRPFIIEEVLFDLNWTASFFGKQKRKLREYERSLLFDYRRGRGVFGGKKIPKRKGIKPFWGKSGGVLFFPKLNESLDDRD